VNKLRKEGGREGRRGMVSTATTIRHQQLQHQPRQRPPHMGRSLLTLRREKTVIVDADGELHGRLLHLALRLQEVHVGLALGGVVLEVPPEEGTEGGKKIRM